jgi:starvation-inducible outer membrane lipoprotein
MSNNSIQGITMKKQMFFTMLIASCFLTACSSGTPEEIKKQKEEYEQREKAREEKLNNPVVKTIGVFDGCEVKFYPLATKNIAL